MIRRQEEKEWEEGMEQLHLLLSAVLIPVMGKWLGRRWSGWCESVFAFILGLFVAERLDAYLVFDRYLRVGLGTTFFFGDRLSVLVQSALR